MTIELNGTITTIGELSGIIDSDTSLGGGVAVGGTIIGASLAERGLKGNTGEKGETGETGNGISSIAKTSSSGLVDAYTITYTNGNTATFTVTNGQDGHNPVITASKSGTKTSIFLDGNKIAEIVDGDKGDTGATGNGISSITLTDTTGSVKTYTITFTNGDTTTFQVTDGEVTNAILEKVLPTDTKSGSVVSFPDGTDLFPALSCVADIEPVQSGTPWQSTTEEQEPYFTRAIPNVGHSVNSEYDTLVGGSVAWNQQLRELNSAYWKGSTNLTPTNIVFSNNSVSFNPSASGSYLDMYTTNYITRLVGHKYLLVAEMYAEGGGEISVLYSKGTGNSHLRTSNSSWTLLGAMWEQTSESKNIQLRCTTYIANMVSHYRNVMLFDLTAMFGTTIADYIYTLEQNNAGDGVAFFRKYFPEDYYSYDSGSIQSVEATAHKTYDSNNTLIGNYALDSDLVLRGIPKLDASNNLYYDGDTYESDGTVTRNTILRAYQSGDESLANVITDGTNTVVYSANSSTETADPFTSPQEIVTNGKEEYTSNSVVPVGHKSRLADIYPISGWSGVDVVDCGINLWDEEWENATVDGTTGVKTPNGARLATKNYIRIAPSTEYYFYCPNASTSNHIAYYDEDKKYISGSNALHSNSVITTPSGAKYLRFSLSSSYGSTYNDDISLNCPSTDHDYHAYNGTTYTVSWSGDAGTVYGGTVDVVSGELTVTHTSITLTDFSAWGYQTTNHYKALLKRADKIGIPMPNTSSEARSVVICSAFNNELDGRDKPYGTFSLYASNDGTFYFWNNDDVASGKNDMISRLEAIQPQIVYELAIPITYTLTAQQVDLLLGQNEVFADTGDVEIEYKADIQRYIAKKLAE